MMFSTGVSVFMVFRMVFVFLGSSDDTEPHLEGIWQPRKLVMSFRDGKP